jgi:CheY-like chemotaxis protein
MRKTKVLIVEDETVIALDIKNTLENMGYVVPEIVTSGEDAIKRTKVIKPDLILMDIKLDGDIDGVNAANKIRNLYEIPVVFLTAFADIKTLERAKKSFPYGYIVKPFEERDLIASIEIALNKYSIERKIKEDTENAIAAIIGTTEIILEEDYERLNQQVIDKINLIKNAANIIKDTIEKL